MLWETYFQPASLAEALDLLRKHGARARVVAGGTDVLVELRRGIRPTATLIDITAIRDLKYVRSDENRIFLGGLATHNDVVASAECVRRALPLAQACWEVGAPQIRTRGTIAGNLITASPANDTITPLMALDAELILGSSAGERAVPLRDFYLGVRRTVMRPDELLREIRFRALRDDRRGLFLKLGLRRAQAISVVNVALVITFNGDTVSDARVTIGCLAPTVVRARTAETFLRGKALDPAVCAEAGRLVCADVAPIDDLRGSAAYRLATLAALVSNGLQRIADGVEATGWLPEPVLLETTTGDRLPTTDHRPPTAEPLKVIHTIINGRLHEWRHVEGKSLLDALREDAGLMGTKEGCAEGECGACTVWLNGQAVMACLVPAPQAHRAMLTTIEGLQRAEGGGGEAGHPQGARLHPLQRAFIERGAVQCGYCIPGMLMAGAKLIEEYGRPSLEQVRVALSGNICRCTGYRKIFDAVQAASRVDASRPEREATG